MTQFCEKNLIPASCDSRKLHTKFDPIGVMDGVKLLLYVENT